MATHTAASIQTVKLISLLKQVDPRGQMHVRVEGRDRLELGADPFKSSVAIDLTTETVHSLGSVAPTSVAPPMPIVGAARTTGNYWYELNGNRVGCLSVKGLLLQSLTALHSADPQLMDKLSAVKKRKRRIVARNKYELFDRHVLADKHAVEFAKGWWAGTNNATTEVKSWLAIAASLSPTQKFSTSLG